MNWLLGMSDYLLQDISSSAVLPELLAPSLKGIRLLAVDDSLDCQGFLAMLFQTYGADAQIVGSASQAIEIFTQFQPHVLIADIAMPILDGFGFLEEIRHLEAERNRPPTPAIAVTALDIDRSYLHLRQAGYQAMFSKPVNIDALIATILKLT